MKYTLTLQEQHYIRLREHLIREDRRERAAFIICGRSLLANQEDRLLSREIVVLSDEELLHSHEAQVSWDNNHFIRVLKLAEPKDLAVIAIHNHPSGYEQFSKTDDAGEYHLFRLAYNRNGGTRPHASLIMMPDGKLIGRVWKSDLTTQSISFIRVIGKSLSFWYPDKMNDFQSPESFTRQQLAFGSSLIQDLSRLTCSVVGCGATGSATALLLTRLGVGHIQLIDQDIVEESNLNRLQGATKLDVGKPKVEVLRKYIEDIGLGTKVSVSKTWISSNTAIDLIKGCDLIFGCTDDHAGRILLNRFAYFYLVPVIDMGLVISVKNNPPEIENLQGRISFLYPDNDCLITKGIINAEQAYAENLRRDDPENYKQLKEEAYVIGEGNPAPSVVTFTNMVASLAVNELLNRLQQYNPNDLVSHKIHFFHRGIVIQPTSIPDNDCRICGHTNYWGRGDMIPFLDMAM